MYVWAQDKMSFVNSENVETFWIDENEKGYEIFADDFVLGSYLNKDDAVNEFHSMFRELECGATSYQMY